MYGVTAQHTHADVPKRRHGASWMPRPGWAAWAPGIGFSLPRFALYRQVLSFRLLSPICGADVLKICQEQGEAEAELCGHLTLAESPFHS